MGKSKGRLEPIGVQNGGGKLEKCKKAQEEEDLCFMWMVGLPDHGVTELRTPFFSKKELFKFLLFSIFHFSKRNISHIGL